MRGEEEEVSKEVEDKDEEDKEKEDKEGRREGRGKEEDPGVPVTVTRNTLIPGH